MRPRTRAPRGESYRPGAADRTRWPANLPRCATPAGCVLGLAAAQSSRVGPTGLPARRTASQGVSRRFVWRFSRRRTPPREVGFDAKTAHAARFGGASHEQPTPRRQSGPHAGVEPTRLLGIRDRKYPRGQPDSFFRESRRGAGVGGWPRQPARPDTKRPGARPPRRFAPGPRCPRLPRTARKLAVDV